MKYVGWPVGAGILIAVTTGATTFLHVDAVDDREGLRNATQNQNAYVQMISGERPMDNASAAAHLARFISPAIEQKDRVGTLLDVRVPRDEFNNVNNIIAMDVAYMSPKFDDNPRTGETGDTALTSEFILLTVRAMDAPKTVLVTPPELLDDGIFMWRNVALVSAIPMALYIVFVLPILLTRERFKRAAVQRKHQRYLRGLSPTARQLYDVRKELARTKPDGYTPGSYVYDEWQKSNLGRAWRKADQAFKLETEGWTSAEEARHLRDLQNELTVIIESIEEGQRTYKEL